MTYSNAGEPSQQWLVFASTSLSPVPLPAPKWSGPGRVAVTRKPEAQGGDFLIWGYSHRAVESGGCSACPGSLQFGSRVLVGCCLWAAAKPDLALRAARGKAPGPGWWGRLASPEPGFAHWAVGGCWAMLASFVCSAGHSRSLGLLTGASLTHTAGGRRGDALTTLGAGKPNALMCFSVCPLEYLCHVYVRNDSLSGVVIADSEYPSRVAFTLLEKVSLQFGWTGLGWMSELGLG